MPNHKDRYAVCDANILIDFQMADEDLLRETATYWKGLFVPDCILHEVRQLSLLRAKELGLLIQPTPYAEIQPTSGLSLEDSSCLLYFSKYSAICISNDKLLRKAYQNIGGEVVWGLEMILLLAEEKQITKNRCKDVASKIYQANPEITEEIYSDFIKKWSIL